MTNVSTAFGSTLTVSSRILLSNIKGQTSLNLIACVHYCSFNCRSLTRVYPKEQVGRRYTATECISCGNAPEKCNTDESNHVKYGKRVRTYEVSYEPYWEDSAIFEVERERPEMVVRGTVAIPAFATSEARVVPSVIGSTVLYRKGQDGVANVKDSYGHPCQKKKNIAMRKI